MKASIYNASAGSGKTYRLAYKYVRDIVVQPLLYRNILAVTFTNKATEEMKRRILLQIHTLAAGKPSGYMEQLLADLPKYNESQIRQCAEQAQGLILHDYSRFTILTIDKFFQRVLRAFVQELGIDIDYSLEIDSAPIVTQGADALIEQITTNESLRRWLMELVQERVEQGQRWSVRDGILALKEELFKQEAREGMESKQSKEELQKIIEEGECEVRRAIDEMRTIAKNALEIITNASLTCNDFKGKSRSLAHIFRRIVESEDGLPEITTSQRESYNNIANWGAKDNPLTGDVAAELIALLDEILSRYAEDVKRINTTRLLRENYRSFALMYDLYHKTMEICHEQNTMLLSETSRFLEEFIRDNDAPFIYEKVGNRYSHFMIDEFQDTSRREWGNFLPLLLNTLSRCKPTESRVLIVGDIKQSIYRWRGGDWRILHSDVARELGASDCEMINMVDNYRSHRAIVRFNNSIIESVVRRENRLLNEEIGEAHEQGKIEDSCFVELHNMTLNAYRDHAQNPKSKCEEEGFVEVVTYPETPPIIETICSAIDRGYRPCDIMVLTRTNREAATVAEELLRFKHSNREARYRFDVMTQEALVVSYAPVSGFMIATLALALNSEDGLQRAIYNHFLGKEYHDTPLTREEAEYLRSIRMLAPIEAIESIIERYHLANDLSNIAYISAIQEQVITYSKSKICDIALFLEWWREKGAMQSLKVERSDSAVEILTIHKAKGLEKRVVIIPYCNWDTNPKASGVNKNFIWSEDEKIGKFPVQYKKAMGDSAFAREYFSERVYTRIDNINTLYVAFTRAAESLHIFIKQNEKGRARGIGESILESLPEGCEVIREEEISRYRYGDATPVHAAEEEAESGRELYIMDQYESSPTELQLRLTTNRYREEADGEGYTPRERGVLLHRIFEQSTSSEQIAERIEAMLRGGQIDEAEYRELQEMIERSMRDPRAVEWFDGEWDMVRCEGGIILPNAESRRPDRVMVRGDRAVVVDYKFGAKHSPAYRKQMRGYMQLMRDMGYSCVEGYVWYLRDGVIEQVEGEG